jgi:hypothetical protein
MILRALHTSGVLDISSQEALQVYNELEPFRLSLKPGQVVEVEDHWRKLKNIDNAIVCGLLEVVEYNYSRVGEEVTHAELEERLAEIGTGGIGLDDLSVTQLPNSGTGSLTYDNTTGIFTYIPPAIGGTGEFASGIELEISEHPIETPGGGNRTFTLPYGRTYEPGTVRLILNGQTLPLTDIIQNAGNNSVTLAAGIPPPKTGDVVVLTYIRTVYPVATGEYPVETPDGSNRTFTLVDGDAFVDDKVGVMVNGIFVDPAFVTKAVDGTSVTIDAPYPAPQANDIVNLMFSRVTDYPIEINIYSVEQPDGATTTFTLPNGDTYTTGDVELLINGQRLPDTDFTENAGKTAVVLDASVPVPVTGDVTTMIYLKPS